MLKKLLLSLGLILSTTPVLADGVEMNSSVSPNMAGNYVIRSTIVTNNNVRGLKFSLHKFDDGKIALEEYPSTFRPGTLNTTAGEKRSVLVSFSGKFDKPQNMAMCMFVDPPKPTEVNISTMVANFRYCKIFRANP